MFVPNYMDTREVSVCWMLIIADTLLLADTSLRDKNNHPKNYYTGEKKIFSLPEQLIQSEFPFKGNKQISTEDTLILSLHKHMQKHLITITQAEMSVLIGTDSRILLFTISNFVGAAASNLQRLCWALYGHFRKKAPFLSQRIYLGFISRDDGEERNRRSSKGRADQSRQVMSGHRHCYSSETTECSLACH